MIHRIALGYRGLDKNIGDRILIPYVCKKKKMVCKLAYLEST